MNTCETCLHWDGRGYPKGNLPRWGNCASIGVPTTTDFIGAPSIILGCEEEVTVSTNEYFGCALHRKVGD